MADTISSASRPIGSNGIEQRLLDPLRLDLSEQSSQTSSSASSTAPGDAFEDFLNGSSTISTVPQSQRPTTFDPADAISSASVYGVPADKVTV
ncbi:MAG: hypothetical protein ACOH2J_16600 [Allorhizobium sp.]